MLKPAVTAFILLVNNVRKEVRALWIGCGQKLSCFTPIIPFEWMVWYVLKIAALVTGILILSCWSCQQGHCIWMDLYQIHFLIGWLSYSFKVPYALYIFQLVDLVSFDIILQFLLILVNNLKSCSKRTHRLILRLIRNFLERKSLIILHLRKHTHLTIAQVFVDRSCIIIFKVKLKFASLVKTIAVLISAQILRVQNEFTAFATFIGWRGSQEIVNVNSSIKT